MSMVNLVSGGIDSTLIGLMAKEEGVEQFPLFINYGQLCAKKEWETCKKIHSKYNLPDPVLMDITGFGQTILSGITSAQMRLNEDAFLPCRNLLFLVVGAAYAYQVHSSGVAIGLLCDEQRIYPDQTKDFVHKCADAIYAALGAKINIITPLIELTKNDVLQLAQARGLKGTYSCHAGLDEPCGVCVSCMEQKTIQIGGK